MMRVRLAGWVAVVLSLVASSVVISSPAAGVAGYGDVAGDRYYARAVQWSVDNNITGIEGACFDPDKPVSRGETAVYMWNMEGQPTAPAHAFNDVVLASQNAAISWMSATGVTTGTSPTTFSPGNTLKRAQIAAFLHRLAGEPPAGPHPFTDVVAGWQQAPVSWLSASGVTTGTSPTTFSPDGTLTRAQLITFLYRYKGEPAVTLNPATPRCEPDADPAAVSRAEFEVSAPEGYSSVTVSKSGTVWGTPARFTSDSSAAAVAYMLVGLAAGCSIADTQAARGATVYVRAVRLGHLPSFESASVCGKSSHSWDTGWEGLRITHLRIFDESSPTNVREYVYDDESGQYVAKSPAETDSPGKFSEFNRASASEWRRQHRAGEIVVCYEGLALPRDSFCLAEGFEFASDYSEVNTTFLVAHLSDGDAFVLRGSQRYRTGGDIRLGWITFEGRVITHLDTTSTIATNPPRGDVRSAPVTLAPTDEEDFKTRFVPYGLSSERFFLQFGDDGRFEEYGISSSDGISYDVGGRFAYRAAGSEAALLILDYADGSFGGACAASLLFQTLSSGILEYLCEDGSAGRQAWRLAALPLRVPPTLRAVAEDPGSLRVEFFDSFEAGETRAYDFQIRQATDTGPWILRCTTTTNSGDHPVEDTASTPVRGLLPGTDYHLRYRYRGSSSCGGGVDRPWSHTAAVRTNGSPSPQPPIFVEGSMTIRLMSEGPNAGTHVGEPVLASGRIPLTYSLEGPDAASFAIVGDSGQIRTDDASTYDYETKRRYEVTVRAIDGEGRNATIDVVILLGDLGPPCRNIPDLRLSAVDERIIARWSRPERGVGEEAALGYQVQLRSAPNGSWGDDQTVFGPQFTGTAYSGLTNGQSYQVRVRPLGNEGTCSWTQSPVATPTAALAPSGPQDLDDRLEGRWIGTPEHHLRFFTPNRCRYVSNGTGADAFCDYRRTSPDEGEIVLEFDDPSRNHCSISLAFSSLTTGSFIDDCWDAGVNTSEFVVPPLAPRTAEELAELIARDGPPQVSSAPRDRDEFLSLFTTRTDLIPGVVIGWTAGLHRPSSLPDVVAVTAPETYATVLRYSEGRASNHYYRWEYSRSGPSTGLLTLVPVAGGGESYRFSLDFGEDGTLGITVTDGDGDSVDWWSHVFEGLESVGDYVDTSPILLVAPPVAPVNLEPPYDLAPPNIDAYWNDHYQRFPETDGWNDANAILGSGAVDPWRHLSSLWYEKVGPTSGRLTLTLGEFDPGHPARDHSQSDEFYERYEGATWEINLEFLTENLFRYDATLYIDGVSTGLTSSGFSDYDGDRTDDDEFPPDVVPPDEPPQARGQDFSGVELAAAATSAGIGNDDVQTLLMRDAGVNPVSYRPGDWLEPKDGGDQRMMIVGVSQVSASGTGGVSGPMVLAAGGVGPSALYATPDQGLLAAQASSVTRLTRLQVVCMQIEKDIPIRGARYFSVPKQVQGPEQSCQRDCALNQTSNIQQCVWRCQEES